MKLDLLFLNDEGLEKEMSENPSEPQIGVPVKEGEVGWSGSRLQLISHTSSSGLL